MDILESCASAEAAASKASILLAKGSIELDPYVAEIIPEKCDGCGLCMDECEYKGVLTRLSPTEVQVNRMLCVGCGACAAVCPQGAINVAGWSIDQYDAMVDALVAEV
jgi:heterodisulfide reductase subunit A